ncbi:hypothetical protein EDM22_00215 [Agromyces tardus]|uniref:Uncharacterized protein n=1 Tax=Agromyces tardus TaxID=2583849 RepID=A0A3M8ALU9_9MICO|nr:hypothetical protein [Agromyces tardus]RNB52186.1 hypothetical protein EDM22_00215 [Agromyces tardus]
MMIDYNVSDHWAESTPHWLKSLVSSLDRRHRFSTVLPLTVVGEEILQWIVLASGVDAWKKGANRDSLERDIAQSFASIGSHLTAQIASELAAFRAAFKALSGSGNAVLSQPPGTTRTAPEWQTLLTATGDMLTALQSDDAVRASWDDLVDAAQDRTLDRRQYGPIADLLSEQLRRRGIDADSAFRGLVSIMAFGRHPDDIPVGEADTPVTDRIDQARVYIGTPATIEPVAVWLGYKGRAHVQLTAGRVSFYEPLWAVPNAEPGRQDFDHKEELWAIVKGGFNFRVPEKVDELREVETLVRVDLGNTTTAGAVERAVAIVDVIINVALHRSGGIRPQLAEHVIVVSGKPVGSGHNAVWNQTGFPDDTYGAGMTSEAIAEHGPRIADTLAREELPRFLAAAIEVQTTLDHPFSRDMALRKPSEADISSVIPLADRIVQHVAAHAAMDPNDLFPLLVDKWAHARWLGDLQRAAGMCLLGGGERRDLQHELTVEWLSTRPKQPWLLLLADRAADFISLCRLEHERGWIERMFASISDHATYRALIAEYAAEGEVLEGRRRRIRNALVHGNPATFPVVESTRAFAEFQSRTALYVALESFVDSTDPQSALAERTDEFNAVQGGTDAATYWRDRVRNEGWPLPK